MNNHHESYRDVFVVGVDSCSKDKSLLSWDSHSSSSSSSIVGVLSSDFPSEPMSDSSVRLDLFESLHIFSESGVEVVSNQVGGGSVLGVFLSVQEPFGNVVFYKVKLKIYQQAFKEYRLACWSQPRSTLQLWHEKTPLPLVKIDLCFLNGNVGISSSNSLDLSHSKADFLLSRNVSVVNTQDMDKISSLWNGKVTLITSDTSTTYHASLQTFFI